MNAPMELPRHALTIADTFIRQDAEGRYCLNDLHRAAGGESKHQPAFFMRRKETADLLAELGASANSQTPTITINDGRNNGTYVAKELVYAYAMWISPAFHLKVIRAYDAMVTAPVIDPMQALNDPATMRGLLLSYSEKVLTLENKVQEQAPKVDGFDRIAKADGSLCFTDAAKTLQMRLKDLIAWLSSHKWIYQRPGTSWIGYQDKIQSGHIEHKTNTVERSDGTEKVVTQARITPKGLAKLAEIFGSGSDLIAA